MERAVFPCSPNPECPVRGCPKVDTHHLKWPSTEYQSALEHTYRNLDENKVEMCRRLHDIEHTLPPPDKPSQAEMFEVVDVAVQESAVYLSAAKRRRIYHD